MSLANTRLTVTLAIVLFCVATVGCNRAKNRSNARNGSGETGNTVASVVVESVKNDSLTRSVELPATIMGYQTTDIYSKVGGFLAESKVDIGATVNKDDVLAILSMPEIEKQVLQKLRLVDQAEAKYNQALAGEKEATADKESFQAGLEEAQEERKEQQAMFQYEQGEYDRIKDLVARNSVRRELLDSAKLKLDSASAAAQSVEARVRTAAAKLRSAEASVDRSKADAAAALASKQVAEADLAYVEEMQKYGTITAPYDGEITERTFDIGAFIQSADGNSSSIPLFQIVQTDMMRVEIEVPMSYVQYLDKGDKAVLSNLDGLTGQSFEATVSRFSSGVNQKNRMMTVEVDFDNAERKLRPGFFGYVEIALQEYTDQPVVSSDAVLTSEGKHHVFVVKSGKAQKTEIAIAYDNGTYAVVANGVQPGDAVIVSGIKNMKDGQAVEVKPSEN